MEGSVRCQPLATCGGSIRLRVRASSLLDNSVTALFVGGCTSFPNTTGIPRSFTVGALDRRLQDLFSGTTSYQWVNDNTGAIAWVNANKCSSLASSFACMAISQLNMLTDVWAADAIHIPGENMGEIDAMSRLEAQADSLTAFPTLTPLT